MIKNKFNLKDNIEELKLLSEEEKVKERLKEERERKTMQRFVKEELSLIEQGVERKGTISERFENFINKENEEEFKFFIEKFPEDFAVLKKIYNQEDNIKELFLYW